MKDYKELYERLEEEFETYQSLAETTIARISERNTKLEKSLDSLANLVEISKYINSYLSDDNLVPMINDVIIGVLGVTYSSIYIYEEERLAVKASNKTHWNFHSKENIIFNDLIKGQPLLLNSKEPIFEFNNDMEDIHSVIGVPIQIRDRLIGYIIEEHTLFGFFDDDHMKFISSIANQIAIAIENNFLYNKIKESSLRDPLLGLYNRKYFYNFVENEINIRKGQPFAIVMLDIDNFKKINDSYGHQFGDKILINTADIINNSLDKKDVVARYGGEEIVFYISDAFNRSEVYERVDGIRKQISESEVLYRETYISVTASLGLSFYPSDGLSVEDVIKKADVLLYKAKNSGKNKVIAAM